MIPALRWIVGAAQAVAEVAGALRGLVRSARRGTLPMPGHDGETDPFPLTHRDVARIQGQIRSATEQRPEMRPPPKPPSTRYD